MAQQKPDNVWTVEPEVVALDENERPITGAVNEEALDEALLELRGILLRVGGAVQIAARRREVGEGSYITERVVIAFNRHLPLPRRGPKQDQPHEEVEAPAVEEPAEPVAAE